MNSIFYNIRTKIGLTISSTLSALGAGSGAATAVCQTTCSTGSALPFFLGFTLSATPLAFIEDYQLPLWWISFLVFSGLAGLYYKKILYSRADKAFLFLNAGLLLVGFPYIRTIEIFPLITWAGIIISGAGLFQLITAKKIAIQFTNPYESKQTN